MTLDKLPLRLLLTAALSLVLMSYSAVADPSAGISSGHDLPPKMVDDRPALDQYSQANPAIYIRLQQAVFDPWQEAPAGPSDLNRTVASGSGPDYYFVQFFGPIRSEWRAGLVGTGAEIMDYVPDFAYVVRMDEQALSQVTALPNVRWVGLYQPVYRLSNELIAIAGRASPRQTTELIIRAFPDEPVETVAGQIVNLGGTLIQEYADSGGGAIFKVSVPETLIADLAFIPAIAWVESALEPQWSNAVARSDAIIGKDAVESALGLYGAGQMVAVGDSGLDTGSPATVHQDFAGRVVGGTWGPGDCGTWADNDSHGTHVAGSVLGSGELSGADIPNRDYTGSHAGTAPEALLYVWSFCNNFSGLPNSPYDDYYAVLRDVDSRLRISTNSWGFTGNRGQYNAFTRETDRFVRDHPDMVLTYAAGNAGTDGNSDGVVDLGSMNMPATAKNVITVGASENVHEGNAFTWGGGWPADYPVAPIFDDWVADDADGMAAFSGRGPTLSNRIKPDIVAPGTNIVSTRNYSTGTGWGVFDADYLYMGGTSMATPLVAGAAAIIREYYATRHELNPTAALVKAALINAANDMTPGQYGTGATQEILRRPDNVQGWGRLNLANALIDGGSRQRWFHEHDGLNTGGTYQVTFDVLDSGPFSATLVWTDFPGTEASHGALVNDLDLVVEDPKGTRYLGNEVLTGGRDAHNNVEGVALNPMTGTYTVTISGFNVPQGPQPFALVVSADGPVGYLTGVIDDGVNPIEGATLTAMPTAAVSQPTDASGTYTLTLPVGTYDLTAAAPGYAAVVINDITVDDDQVIVQNFSLPPAPPPVTNCVEPALAIPDNSPAGVDSILTVSQTEEIADLNLYIRATHTYVGDLILTLTHPDGVTSVVAIDRPGRSTTGFGCGGDDMDVWVDDEGADTEIENQCSNLPAISGRAIGGDPPSASLLATFDGLASDGIWTLNVSDNAAGDEGSLDEWCLEITPVARSLFDVDATVSSGEGTITPSSQTVLFAGTASFTVTPAMGWSLDSVNGTSCVPALVEGVDWEANNIQADCAVEANFDIITYTVTATAGEGGSITPTEQTVEHGSIAAFTVSPDQGFLVDLATGCGGSLDELTYIIAAADRNCEVSVTFRVDDRPAEIFSDGFEQKPGG